jgi:exodeoxyribonuclease-3
MKIITWNVNGFRSGLSKNAFDWIRTHKPDVMCLQEVKVKPKQIRKNSLDIFPDFRIYWNSAYRAGYSGVATFSKIQPLYIQKGMRDRSFFGEGRILMTKYSNLILINVYFPNGKRDQSRLEYKLQFYSALLNYCDVLQSKGEKLIICGDFNTAHNEIDLRNPKQNSKTSGFLPEERLWLDKYHEQGFIDIYREIYPDKVQYTWWTYRNEARSRNIGWRLDMFFVSSDLLNYIEGIEIYENIYGSDHCPVSLEILR